MNETSEFAAQKSATPTSPHASGALGILLRIAAAIVIFFAFAGDGLKLYFSGDDVLNLYKYIDNGWGIALGVVKFWSPHFYRPVGGLVYMGMYALFGFNALAFRLFAYSILMLNLGLVWCVARQIFGDRRVALFAVLLVCYHAGESEIYYSFGTIYDVLCFTFVLTAVAYWIHRRRAGGYPGAGGFVLLCVLQVLAVSSKEMGVCLPVFLLLWELVNGRAVLVRKPWVNWRLAPTLGALGAIVLIYIVGKGRGAEALTNNPLYAPHFNAHTYLTVMSGYLNQTFYVQTIFHPATTAAFLIGGIVLGAVLRLRLLIFGWLWFIVGMLPVAFIAPRAPFVLYVPLVGLAIAFTGALMAFSEKIHLPAINPAEASMFILASVLLVTAHHKNQGIFDIDTKELSPVRAAWTRDLGKAQPYTRGASILFLADPFPEDWWDPLFLTSLYRQDPKLTAARVKKNQMLLAPQVASLFTEVFDYRDGKLIRVPKTALPEMAAQDAKVKGFAAPKFGLYASTDAWWWTQKDFGIDARCPEAQESCVMEVSFVTPIGPFETGDKRTVAIDVAGQHWRDVQLTAQFDQSTVKVDLPGGKEVATTFHIGQVFPPEKLNGDTRSLAIVISGVRFQNDHK